MADILASVAGVRLAGLPFAGGPGAAWRRGRVNPLGCILPASRRGGRAGGGAWGRGGGGRGGGGGCGGRGGPASPAGNCTLTAPARGAGNVFQRCWSAASLGGRRGWHRLDYGGFQVVADILGRFGVFCSRGPTPV